MHLPLQLVMSEQEGIYPVRTLSQIHYICLEVVWKNRDILKQYEDGTLFMIVGIESQTDVHYCMPLRNLLYDALSYEEQRIDIYRDHKRKL